MNSCIFIDGIILWIILAVILLIFFGFICFGLMNLKLEKQKDRLKDENKSLKRKVALLKEEYYKATYKIPEVE